YCGCQVAPASEVAKLRPPAVVTVASLALPAATATRLSAVGAGTIAKSSPTVVLMIVPARPTIQHTAADGAAPAIRSVFTPLCWMCVPPSASRRRTIPFLPTIHVTDRSGGEIVTSTSAPATAPPLEPTARAATAAPTAAPPKPCAPTFAAAPDGALIAGAPGAAARPAILWVTSPLIACARGAASGLASFIASSFGADAATGEAGAT